ncbi:hypothetical protein CIB48_g8625 [Xylaria polymorpha]|nr:hypothetical protein CIB48_g8625 [Xylaria polymorpha]
MSSDDVAVICVEIRPVSAIKPKGELLFAAHPTGRPAVFVAPSMYLESYGKFRDAIFRITTVDGEKVVVPLKYLEELRSKPEEVINHAKANERVFETKITGMSIEHECLNRIIRADLTRKVPMKKGDKLPDTMLAWMVERAEEFEVDATELVDAQLILIMAGIHSTVMTITQMLYDLAAYPECTEDLRAEIRSVLAEKGGVMNNSHALFQMKLLDSFMLESQRHNPILMSMRSTPKLFTAVVGKTDGTQIPAGVYMSGSTGLQGPTLYLTIYNAPSARHIRYVYDSRFSINPPTSHLPG